MISRDFIIPANTMQILATYNLKLSKFLPETIQNIRTQIQANRLEGFNASLRRKSVAYRRKTNTYAKNNTRLQQRLDTIWLVHNFGYVHFSIKQVPDIA